MGAVQKTDVNVNIAQDFSDTQKAQGRANIGATRVVFIDTTATNADILQILLAGDTPVLRVVVASTSSLFNLARVATMTAVFSAVIDGNVVTYTCAAGTWTRTETPYRSDWASFTPDTLQTTEAKSLFTIGNIEFGYYFDNGSNFRLAMRSTSGTRYVYLADHRGSGGGYALTTGWTAITIYGFTTSNQLESFKGYDTTGGVNLEFDVYFANGANASFPMVAQYRVNS